MSKKEIAKVDDVTAILESTAGRENLDELVTLRVVPINGTSEEATSRDDVKLGDALVRPMGLVLPRPFQFVVLGTTREYIWKEGSGDDKKTVRRHPVGQVPEELQADTEWGPDDAEDRKPVAIEQRNAFIAVVGENGSLMGPCVVTWSGGSAQEGRTLFRTLQATSGSTLSWLFEMDTKMKRNDAVGSNYFILDARLKRSLTVDDADLIRAAAQMQREAQPLIERALTSWVASDDDE